MVIGVKQMKYCTKCGNELVDEAVVCTKCGCATNSNSIYDEKSKLYTVAKVFMIIGTVFSAFFYLIPLAWCIPMTISYTNKIKNGEKVSTGFKVCCLLFVSFIGGIIMLCDNN